MALFSRKPRTRTEIVAEADRARARGRVRRAVAGYRQALEVIAGVPRPVGCLVSGLVMIAYFSGGGLLAAAWVNLLELARGGVLGIIHAHQISLSNMTRLAEWHAERELAAAPALNATTA